MSNIKWRKKRFEVKSEHLKLLNNAYVDWNDREFGAPSIDCKRPYGNSSVLLDMHELLTDSKSPDDFELTEEQQNHYRQLHKETQIVLQIILATQSFVPGIYEADEYHWNWRLIEQRDARITGA